jgi:hypothetical protein
VTVAALVKVAPPPNLPCPTCAPTSPANCWWCVGSAGSGWYEQGGVTASGGSAAKSGGGGSGAVLCCCLVLWASCHVRAAWHGNGHGALSALAWGGPGWCMGVGSPLPVHRGASLCPLPAAVHRGGGPTVMKTPISSFLSFLFHHLLIIFFDHPSFLDHLFLIIFL